MIRPDITEREAERTVIGVMLKRSDKIAVVRERLRADDFANETRRGIFTAVLAAFDANGDADLLTVGVEYEKAHNGQDATDELVECATTYTTAALIDTYCGYVIEMSQRRRISRIADEIGKAAMESDTDIAEAIESARRRLLDIMRCDGEVKTKGEVMMAALDYAERVSKGLVIPCVSGLSTLDDFTGGYYPGELTLIGARPSVGKTAAALMADTAISCKGKHVLMASAEMEDRQIGQRLLADAASVNAMKIRRPKTLTDDEWGRLGQGLVRWADLPAKYLFERNVDRIIGTARRYRDRGECDILLVDYVQLLTTSRRFDADRLRVEYISHELKALSLELDIPVVALAQLARPKPGEHTVPGLESLSDSSALEKDADSVIILHRPESAKDEIFQWPGFDRDKDVLAGLSGTGKRLIYFLVAKQRQGTIGSCATIYDGAYGRFVPLAR